jgi:hypothetical protein
MSAKLFVLDGEPDHASGGETPAPSHVYLVGIDLFAANADEERLSVVAAALADVVSTCGRPMLVTTAAVSVCDDVSDFAQAPIDKDRIANETT